MDPPPEAPSLVMAQPPPPPPSSPTAGQKRPLPYMRSRSASSEEAEASTSTAAGVDASTRAAAPAAPAGGGGGGAAAAAAASPASPSPWGGGFPFRAAGPRMRVERAYDPATGEHRCLVYRADRRAAVAKIIWTTANHTHGDDDEGEEQDEEGESRCHDVGEEGKKKEEEERRCAMAASASTISQSSHGQEAEQEEEEEEEEEEERGQQMVVLEEAGERRRLQRVAHVKSVFVHESMRGSGLGRLLFFQLFATLQREWRGRLGVLKLEAEEDVRRHDRLVRYYRSLGFCPTPDARVLYLSHQDACFRKVPMYREIQPSSSCSPLSSLLGPEELDAGASFTVVVLRASRGSRTPLGETGAIKEETGEQQRVWVLVQDAAGGVSLLESRAGRFLCAEPDGTVVVDRAVLSTWEVFELEQYELVGEGAEATAGGREVFAFRTFHGQYLRVADDEEDATSFSSSLRPGLPLLALTTAQEPTLWEVSPSTDTGGGRHSGDVGGGGGQGPRVMSAFRLPQLLQGGGGGGGSSTQQMLRKKCAEGPKQATVRAVHRKMRRINSVAFVRQMRAKWGRMDAMARFRALLQEKRRAAVAAAAAAAAAAAISSSTGAGASPPEQEEEAAAWEGVLSMEGAVRRLCTHLDPLQPALADRGVSYGHTLLWIAEYIRAQGYPEWLQLVGLLHGLGRLAFVLFLEASRDFQSEYEDWAFGGQAWVVGCPFPDAIRYREVNKLNPDHDDSRYASSPTGMYSPHCGLDRVLLNFSGAEYLTLLLQGQRHCLPAEALALVRYVDLDLWHSQGYYRELATPADEAVREDVKAFHQLRADALAAMPPWASGTQPPVSLERVWPHYQRLLDTYLPEGLRW